MACGDFPPDYRLRPRHSIAPSFTCPCNIVTITPPGLITEADMLVRLERLERKVDALIEALSDK